MNIFFPPFSLKTHEVFIIFSMDNKKKERNRVDKYRKRRRFHGYKPEKVTTTTTQSESMHMQDGEEPYLSFVAEEVENLKTINKIVPITINSNSSQGTKYFWCCFS